MEKIRQLEILSVLQKFENMNDKSNNSQAPIYHHWSLVCVKQQQKTCA